MLVSITYVLVSMTCVDEYNMCVGHDQYNMCVGQYNISVVAYIL